MLAQDEAIDLVTGAVAGGLALKFGERLGKARGVERSLQVYGLFEDVDDVGDGDPQSRPHRRGITLRHDELANAEGPSAQGGMSTTAAAERIDREVARVEPPLEGHAAD